MMTAEGLDLLRLGRQIKDLRLQADLSVEELGARAKVTGAYVSRLERGLIGNPGYSALLRIARALREAIPEETERQAHITELLPALNPPNGLALDINAEPADLRGRPTRAAYGWGICGNPLDHESPPDPFGYEPVPTGKEDIIGPRGFAVYVRGESMARNRIHDGDIAWVNPDAAPQLNRPVLACVQDGNGDSGMVIKLWRRTRDGERLFSNPADGEQREVACASFTVIGRVVWVEPSGHPPA